MVVALRGVSRALLAPSLALALCASFAVRARSCGRSPAACRAGERLHQDAQAGLSGRTPEVGVAMVFALQRVGAYSIVARPSCL